MLKCPECGQEAEKVIYAGIPANLCITPVCSTLWGFFSGLIVLLPFNGMFFVYEGNYFLALIDWWRECGNADS